MVKKNKPVSIVEKPPIGLRPRKIADLLRLNEILDALSRYANDKKPVPPEWINEAAELVARLN